MGQVKYLCSLSIRCCLFPAARRLMGHHTFSRKRAFSARRFCRLRENMRYTAMTSSTVDKKLMTRCTVCCLMNMLATSRSRAAQIVVKPS